MLTNQSSNQPMSLAAQTAFHDQFAQMQRALRHYEYFVDRTLSEPRLSLRSAKFLERNWTGKRAQWLSLAQEHVRAALSQAVMFTMLNHAQSDESAFSGRDRFRMITTCPNIGYTDLARAKLRPLQVVEHARRAMRRHSLEGFGLIDIALIVESTGIEPTELGLHYHVACMPSEPSAVSMRPFQESRLNKHGLAVVDISVGQDPLTPQQVACLGYYVSKISCGTKNAGARSTTTSHDYWGREAALRGLEAYSHLHPVQSLIGEGSLGKALQDDCARRFEGFLGEPYELATRKIDHRKLRCGWRHLYDELGLGEWRALRIARGTQVTIESIH